jgi:hypothetical protein
MDHRQKSTAALIALCLALGLILNSPAMAQTDNQGGGQSQNGHHHHHHHHHNDDDQSN